MDSCFLPVFSGGLVTSLIMFVIARRRVRPLRACCPVAGILLLLAITIDGHSQARPRTATASAPSQAAAEQSLREAEARLRELVRAHPNNPAYLFELGDVYLFMGKPQLAIPLLKRCLHLRTGNWDARMALAQAYQKNNKDADALQILGTTPPAGSTAELWAFSRAFSLYRVGDFSTALSLFKRLLKSEIMQAPANFFVANCYSEMVKYRAALPYYEAAIKFGNSRYNKALNLYYYDYGLALFKLGKYEESQDAFKKSIERFANDPLPWYYLGQCEARLGSFEEAKDAFETAIRKDGSFNPAYYRLARLYAAHGDKKKAQEFYNKVSSELQQQLVESQRLKFGSGPSTARRPQAHY